MRLYELVRLGVFAAVCAAVFADARAYAASWYFDPDLDSLVHNNDDWFVVFDCATDDDSDVFLSDTKAAPNLSAPDGILVDVLMAIDEVVHVLPAVSVDDKEDGGAGAFVESTGSAIQLVTELLAAKIGAKIGLAPQDLTGDFNLNRAPRLLSFNLDGLEFPARDFLATCGASASDPFDQIFAEPENVWIIASDAASIHSEGKILTFACLGEVMAAQLAFGDRFDSFFEGQTSYALEVDVDNGRKVYSADLDTADALAGPGIQLHLPRGLGFETARILSSANRQVAFTVVPGPSDAGSIVATFSAKGSTTALRPLISRCPN